jgi:poly(3-hydroxybutyrate) depolymerase
LATVLSFAAQAADDGPHLVKNAISVGGQDRSYFYYVSSKVDNRGFNYVVYALHDDGETAQQFAERSGWLKVAEDSGFIVIFPESAGKVWAENSGGEDDYLNAVYEDASTHMLLPPNVAPPPRGGNREALQGEGGGGARGAGEGEGAAGRGGNRAPRAMTWLPFQDLMGVGAGARVAQAFAMNHPGIFGAIAAVDGGPYGADYAKTLEPAQNHFEYMRGGKSAIPQWHQRKSDVPVAAWLFTTGAQNAQETRQIDYWKRVDHVGAGAAKTLAGYQTSIFHNPANPGDQVRITQLPASAKFDANLASSIWGDFFAHIARWTSSPNGDLGRVMTQDEVNKAFEVRTLDVAGKTYKYYLKLPTAYHKGTSLPLVLSAHGFGFPAWLYLSQIKMHEIGEKEGFITVYLQGQANGWDFTDPDGADAQYVEKVISEVEASYGTDPSRVYMQGFSFGSGLTYMMGVAHPELFAAVSPNSGIGPMSQAVEARIAADKAESDIRIPMIVVYGDVDAGGSADGKIPGDGGVLQPAIDEMKKFDRITTPDKTELFHSPSVPPYQMLIPGGKLVMQAKDNRYPNGRLSNFQYVSADAKPLNLFDFVWVTDMAHGGDPRQAQLEWDYFKHWRRNSNGTLKYVP